MNNSDVTRIGGLEYSAERALARTVLSPKR